MVAVTFLTRLRVPGHWDIEAADVGRSALFFPLVGAGIGAMQCGLIAAAHRTAAVVPRWSQHPYRLPSPVLAVLVVVLGVLVTGALHLDGLADMADGFGGGRSRNDVLRIMRDHAMGAYGGTALILVLALKIASVISLMGSSHACQFLIAAPVLARGSIAVLCHSLPYARGSEDGMGASVQQVGIGELAGSLLTAIVFVVWLGAWRGAAAVAVVVIVSLGNARICLRRIQGFTGDTLGANVEACEALVLALGAILN